VYAAATMLRGAISAEEVCVVNYNGLRNG